MKKVGIVLLASLALIGCTGTQKGATIGGIAGAALGGIIGYQNGHGVEGALIGGGVGAAGGALTGDAMDESNK
jgi:hypothetical protein